METPIKLNISEVVLVKGNYEGYDYYKLVAKTDIGMTLSTKLTLFEYNTLMSRTGNK